MKEIKGTLAMALANARPSDVVTDTKPPFPMFALQDVRTEMVNMGCDVLTFMTLPPREQDIITDQVFNRLRTKRTSNTLAIPPTPGTFRVNTGQEITHPHLNNQIGKITVEDLYKLQDSVTPGASLYSEWVRGRMRALGYDPDKYMSLKDKVRVKLARRLLRELHAIKDEQQRKAEAQRDHLFEVRAAEKERSKIFKVITQWNEGPLVLEKPQGSSFHHVVEYSRRTTVEGAFARALENGTLKMPQLFIVDHDWDKAFSKSEGFNEIEEWPLPYEYCCFEFRISGVRVLAFLTQDDVNDGGKFLHCVYGKDEHWLSDDFEYHIKRGQRGEYTNHVTGRKIDSDSTTKLHYVTALVVAQVRAVCIMLDARVAEPERRAAPAKLNEKRRAQGRPLVQDHHVIYLSKRRRGQVERDKTIAASGRHVRLHWRRGHWRHFERILDNPDPDVKIIERANESGIWTSAQWINSMLVGDESLGFVEKEYRL